MIAILAVFALLAIGAWFLIIQPHEELVQADAGGHPSTPVSVGTRAAPPPLVNVEAMDISQLLSEARKAINEQRYLAPAGNNAFEFYLRVLEKQPGNKVASDALRETFPFAADSAEQAVNAGNFGDAQRQIDLLAKADPTNFTLTILRSKLDAQRKLQDKQQQAVDQQKVQELAVQKAAADKLAVDKLAEQQKALLADQEKAKQARVEKPAAPAAKPAAGETAAAGSVAGQTSEAVLVKGVAPSYPPSALRAKQSGWVVVAFTIEPNGRTSNVHVTDAQPRRVFDRAAMEAVLRYRFTPAMKDGVAVASERQQKIEFNL